MFMPWCMYIFLFVKKFENINNLDKNNSIPLLWKLEKIYNDN